MIASHPIKNALIFIYTMSCIQESIQLNYILLILWFSMQSFCENEKTISFSMKLPSFRVKNHLCFTRRITSWISPTKQCQIKCLKKRHLWTISKQLLFNHKISGNLANIIFFSSITDRVWPIFITFNTVPKSWIVL